MSLFRNVLIQKCMKKKQIDYLNMPITLQTLEAENTITLNKSGSPTEITCFYKVNDGDWTAYTVGTGISLPNIGDKVSFKCSSTTFSNGDCKYYAGFIVFVSSPQYYYYTISKNTKVYGNVMSLVNFNTVLQYEFQFYSLFMNCTKINDIDNLYLPATILTNCCYYKMFYGCTGITRTRNDFLPTNITLATSKSESNSGGIYKLMFANCTNLSSTITEINNNFGTHSVMEMFYGCTSLTTAPILLGSTISHSDEYDCFAGCNLLTSITSYASSLYMSTRFVHFNGRVVKSNNLTDVYLPNMTKSSFLNGSGGAISDGTKTIHCSDETFSYTFPIPSCFPYGTKITMADGTKKNVEDLTYNDELKVWDFDNGCYSTAKICWLTCKGLMNDHFYRLTFSDGTVLKTTGTNSNHKVYDVDKHYFEGVDRTKVGDRIFSQNGIVTITNKEYIQEQVYYMNVITSKKFDCFAEGILTADRYGRIYPIDDNMKFIKDDRQIRPYSEFEAAGISQYWYDHLRLGQVNETIEQTVKYIQKIESQMEPLPNN